MEQVRRGTEVTEDHLHHRNGEEPFENPGGDGGADQEGKSDRERNTSRPYPSQSAGAPALRSTTEARAAVPPPWL